MRRRKAQLSIQFNWLFVLIVGGVILFFFITLINGRTKTASVQEAVDLKDHLETLFVATMTEEETTGSFGIRDADVEIVCTFNGQVVDESSIYIQGTGPFPTNNVVLFSPARLRGDTVRTWTQTWKVPFEVTTFTMMATDRTLFVFVGSDVEYLYNGMPENFTKRYVEDQTTLNGLDASGFDRYVFITELQISIPTAYAEKAHLRVIDPEDSGVDFQEPGDTAGTPKHYLAEPLIWGAIFAEDAYFYECTVLKALERLRIVSKLLYNRASDLEEDSENDIADYCYDRYYDAKDYFGDFMEADDPDEIHGLKEQQTALENLFKEAQRGYTCPSIY